MRSAKGKPGQSPGEFLTKHGRCEWGELDAHDTEANKAALRDGSRILGIYTTRLGDKVWVLTEADRSSTCLLTPDEY